MANLTKMQKKNLTRTILLVVGISFLLVFFLYFAPLLGWYSLSATPDSDTETEYEFVFIDPLDGTEEAQEEVEDATTTWYKAKISTLDSEEIEDLSWGDFVATSGDETLDPDEDYCYIAKITLTGYVTQYWCDNALVMDANMPLIQYGINNVYLYNQTEDVSIACYSIGGVTFADTSYRDWTVVASCLDASEGVTADVTSLEGYDYHFNPEDGNFYSPCIKLVFNTTALPSYASLQDPYTTREVCSSTAMYIEIDTNIHGVSEFDLRLGSGLGTDFEMVSIDFGYENAETFISWDQQL